MMEFTPSTPTADGRPAPRLHRSATDRVVSGVCGGIAEYLAVDPSLVRLAFVVGTHWGGIGLLVYLVLAIVLPVDDQAPVSVTLSSDRSRALAGLVLVVFGGMLLAANLGWAPWLSWDLFWPGLLILVGVSVMLRDRHSAKSG